MSKVTFDPDEPLLAELSPTRRSVIFPVLELVLITGLIWLVIGWIDAELARMSVSLLGFETVPLTALPAQVDNATAAGLVWLRRGLIVLWLILAWRRCIKHLIFRARSRMVLTDRRLITASGHLRSQIAQIPLHSVVDARAHGSTVAVYIIGQRMPVELHSVPQAKKFVRILRQQIGAL
ncbi:MAG TPA: hypothetical protein H9867_06485 [Candidatus Corynebacterium gallistercoris]|uniref:Uncharacterized protein n=1 Tax=Candidatus Corynebacterium gallistercoris TaxID=2838530 RepID=A0A9D1RX36_9CORY|nr:hypothetical protein [Candidatus Corynebacterium gallistercoris]